MKKKQPVSPLNEKKDYAARYGRNPATSKEAKGKKTILATDDYDGEYLNRRLNSGR